MTTTRISQFRRRLHTIINEDDTMAGKAFDLFLLFLIILSIAAVMLESVTSIRIQYGATLAVIEWIITAFFTVEYIGRLLSVRQPLRYALSFYGIIDFLATITGYIGIFSSGWHFLTALRAVRLLRVFRILKLGRFIGAGDALKSALRQSKAKIAVFVFCVIVLCIILGTLMFLIEGPEHGFTSIPVSVYWTIVTLTTVGFGDITPQTSIGQFISVVIMILGYGIIAVPTGLVSAQLIKGDDTVHMNTQACPECAARSHRDDAKFCYRCGSALNPEK